MNSVRKQFFKVASLQSLVNPSKSVAWTNRQYQSLPQVHRKKEGIVKKLQITNLWNSCRGVRQIHNRGTQKLVEFLNKKVWSEYSALKTKTIPTELHGFEASLDGANVTFTKQIENETIRIIVNVNLLDKTAPKLHPSEPTRNFLVKIIQKDTTLNVYCTYPLSSKKEVYQVHQILGIGIVNGASKSDNCIRSEEAVNDELHGHILQYLEEKGITIEFIEELSKYSKAYEQLSYLCLLNDLSKFASGK